MRSILTGIGIGLYCFGSALADWVPTAAGTYDYGDPANWSDGTPNGVFSQTLDGAQTITFGADTVLADGLVLSYGGKYALTFVSAATDAESGSAKPVTVTLGGDILMNPGVNDGAVVVNFGSTAAGQGVNLDLGGEVRTIDVTQGKTALKLFNQVTNGGLVLVNTGTVLFNDTTSDYALGTTIRGTGPVNVMQNSLGTGTITVENASFITSGSRTFTNNNPIELKGKLYFNGNNGNLNLGAGPLTIATAVTVECSKNTLTLGGQVDSESPCGIDAITKAGGGTLATAASVVTDADVTLTNAQGIWNFGGAIETTGAVAFTGGANGTAFVNLSSTENSFSGEVTVAGSPNQVTISFTTSGSRPLGATFKLLDNGALQSSSAYACANYLSGGLISADSVGMICLGVNETADLSLADYSQLWLGASGSDRTLTGTILPSADGVWRLGGGGKSLILASANALSGAGRLEVSGVSGGNVILSAQNQIAGGARIFTGGILELKEGGALTGSNIDVYGGTLYINSTGKAGQWRADTVHLHGGYFQYAGNKNNDTIDAIGKLILDVRDPEFDTAVGGVNRLNLVANGKTAEIQVGELERRHDMIFRIAGTADGNKLRVGGADGTNTARLRVLDNETAILSALVGGGGADGTTTMSVYPFAYIDNGTYNDSLVTYGANGFRGLDLDTEYATNITPGTVSQENVRLPVGTVFNLPTDTTVNSLFLQGSDPNKGATTVEGEGTLKLTSGVLVMGYHRNNSPYVKCPVDFGDQQGVVCFSRGKGSYWQGAIHGTAGAIFFQTSESAASGSGGTGLQVTGNAVKDSTLTGDVVIHGRIDASVHEFFPGGAERPGDIYAHGHANLAGGKTAYFNAVFGIGYFYRGDDTLNIGAAGGDGDLAGAVIGKTTLNKVGAGRQRIGGACEHSYSTTVMEGVLQVDGSFSASAVTVKSGATLAGSGEFAKAVTMEDGARLEAGSQQTDDQVLEFNGGLTLQGDAALDLVSKDRETLGGVRLAGALTLAEGKCITVNVLVGAGETLKSGIAHVVCESTEELSLSQFRRGPGCPALSLSADARQLLLTPSGGSFLIFR